MTRRGAPGVAALAILVGGCATMDAKPISPDGPREGIGYVLPYTQWTVTVAWRLDFCPSPANPADAGKDAGLAVKIEAAPGSADDGELSFIINPQDLQTLTSVTTFAAKWQDGRNMLSSINVSAEDRSAQIVANLVKTAVKIIPLAAGIPPVLGAPGAGTTAANVPPPPPPLVCGKTAAGLLAIAQAAQVRLEERTTALRTATQSLDTLRQKAATTGDETKEALDTITKAQSEQAEAEQDLSEALDPITYRRTVSWPKGGNAFSGGPITVDRTKVGEWIPGLEDRAIARSSVYLQIERTGSFGRNPEHLDLRAQPGAGTLADDPANPVDAAAGSDPYRVPPATSRGLRYRMPANGVLVACTDSPCGVEGPSVIGTFPGPVVQLGYVNVLPFRSRAFGNNALAAEFNADGSLKSVGYEQKAAPLEGATGALAGAADQLSGALDPTARLTGGNAYLEALKKRRDDLAALAVPEVDPVAEETTALGAETTLLNARLAHLQAEIALEQLRATQAQ